MQQVLAHFDRIEEIYTEDHRIASRDVRADLRGRQDDVAVFVSAYGISLERAARQVEKGLRNGIGDGSVRSDIDIARAVNDISTAVFGIAFWWTALPYQYDLGRS